MSNTTLKDKKQEPLLAGDLNERFYRAVQERPVLFYDVVQTGYAALNQRKVNGLTEHDGHVAYEIILLHSENVTDAMLANMMVLQDKVARHTQPHAENAIDYKSEEDVIAHYSAGGLGFGIVSVSGELIGQVMLSCKQAAAGPLRGKNDAQQAKIGWLMVDRAYGGNLLCDALLSYAIQLAESGGMDQISADVRLHNQRGITKFAAKGFVVAETGKNMKDGSSHLKLYKSLDRHMQISEEVHPRPQSLAGLQDDNVLEKFGGLLGKEGLVAKWDRTAKWFTLHRMNDNKPQMQLVTAPAL